MTESDKATMDVPAPSGGTVERLLVKVGDKVSKGSPILLLQAGNGAMTPPPSLISQQEPPPTAQAPPVAPPPSGGSATAPASAPPFATAPAASHPAHAADFGQVHASPSVRRIARELAVDLTKVRGTGEKGRITKEDVLAVLRGPAAATAPAAAAGA